MDLSAGLGLALTLPGGQCVRSGILQGKTVEESVHAKERPSKAGPAP